MTGTMTIDPNMTIPLGSLIRVFKKACTEADTPETKAVLVNLVTETGSIIQNQRPTSSFDKEAWLTECGITSAFLHDAKSVAA